jgi:hypothetical protein
MNVKANDLHVGRSAVRVESLIAMCRGEAVGSTEVER